MGHPCISVRNSVSSVFIRYIEYAVYPVVIMLVIGLQVVPAYAGPALYFRILSPPQIEKMSFSACAGKAYRTVNLRVKGQHKLEKSYALGWNNEVTVIVACYKMGNTVTATVMVTSQSKDKASKLLPQLVGDMRTPNF